MPKFTIVQPVEHDHVRVETGEIELLEEAARPLIAVGAIVEVLTPTAAPDTAPGPASAGPDESAGDAVSGAE